MISIIIPVYKVEKYLHKCINSILEQSFIDFELLLIDDGSPDLSGTICDEYAVLDSRVRVFHKPNGGVSSARNLGIDSAKGEYVIFCDADDYWCDSDILKKMYVIATGLQVDIVRAEYKSVNEEGVEIYSEDVTHKLDYQGKRLNSGEFLRYIIHNEFYLVLCLIRIGIIKNLRFDESQIFLEDMSFFISLLSRAPQCAYMPNKFYCYRNTPTSVSARIDIKKISDAFKMCNFYFQKSYEIEDSDLKEFCQESSIMVYYRTLQTISDNPYYQQRRGIIKDLHLNNIYNETIFRQKQFKTKIPTKVKLILSVKPFLGILLFRFGRLYNRIKAWTTQL